MLNKIHYKRLLFLLILCCQFVLLGGCGKDKDVPVYYCDVKPIKPVQVPDNLSNSKIQDNYPMPKLTKPLSGTKNISLMPPDSSPSK